MEILDELTQFGGAFRMAERLQTDDVIDQADTRRLLIQALTDAPPYVSDERYNQVDPW